MMAKAAAKTVRKPYRRPRRQPVKGARYWPHGIVLLASLLSMLPIVSLHGWWPDFAFLFLIAWRLQRPLAFGPWFPPLAGLWNDVLAGHPIGLSVFTFSLALLVADLIERRILSRDFVTEWLVASLMILAAEVIQWWVARAGGADLPITVLAIPLLTSMLCYPLIARLVSYADAKRFRR